MKNKHKMLNGIVKKMMLGGPKEEEARRLHRMVKIASLNIFFRTYQSKKNAGSDNNGHKGRGKERKG